MSRKSDLSRASRFRCLRTASSRTKVIMFSLSMKVASFSKSLSCLSCSKRKLRLMVKVLTFL